MKKFDERDTMFARMSYKEGREIYKAYYNEKPHLKEGDDSLRSLGTDCGLCIANCPFTYGISKDLISNIKFSSETRQNILKNFEAKYGIRPIIREEVEWLK